MRFMYDGVTPSRIDPEDGGHPAELVAAYVDGPYAASYPDAVARFPDAVHVAIAIAPWDDGQVLDVEQFDARPDQAPAWAIRQRARGQIPTIYCSESVWQPVLDAFRSRCVAPPLFDLAHYGQQPADLHRFPASVVALQYRNTPGYDLSAVRDFWPGVDAPRHHHHHHHPAPRPHRHHVVREGDTLSGIAEAMGVRLADLEAANPRAGHPPGSFDVIWPGDVIYRPRRRS